MNQVCCLRLWPPPPFWEVSSPSLHRPLRLGSWDCPGPALRGLLNNPEKQGFINLSSPVKYILIRLSSSMKSFIIDALGNGDTGVQYSMSRSRTTPPRYVNPSGSRLMSLLISKRMKSPLFLELSAKTPTTSFCSRPAKYIVATVTNTTIRNKQLIKKLDQG